MKIKIPGISNPLQACGIPGFFSRKKFAGAVLPLSASNYLLVLWPDNNRTSKLGLSQGNHQKSKRSTDEKL